MVTAVDASPPAPLVQRELRPGKAGTCVHRPAPPSQWVWLPRRGKGVLQLHPWCRECGHVKTIGDEGGIPMGGILNLLCALERHLEKSGIHVSEAQHRLIVRSLREQGVDDVFSMSRQAQDAALLSAVCRYTGVPALTLESHLRSM